MLARVRRSAGRLVAAWSLGWMIAAGGTGCGKDKWDVGRTVPVAGKVTMRGKPLTTGVVIFHPDSAKGNTLAHEARGEIDGQGNYQLSTAGKGGAPPGWYQVAVISVERRIDPQGVHGPPRWRINPRYGNPNRSGLAVQVLEDAPPEAYDLQLSP